MRYRRAKAKGGTFFFTVVTFKRMRILTKESNVDLFRESLKHVIESHPFKIDAFVLLPNQLHCKWTLNAVELSDMFVRHIENSLPNLVVAREFSSRPNLFKSLGEYIL